MRDRLSEMLEKAIRYADTHYPEGRPMEGTYTRLMADHLLAAGVIVTPCKVGDVVYFVSRGEIIPMVVNCISFNGNYQYCLTCNYVDEERHGYSSLSFTDRVRGYMFGFTKEEAERALTERREG